MMMLKNEKKRSEYDTKDLNKEKEKKLRKVRRMRGEGTDDDDEK
jgi:hypothetical protein